MSESYKPGSITIDHHWLKAVKHSLIGCEKPKEVYFDKIFIGHIDSDLNYYLVKYFRDKKANLCLPLTRSEVDLPLKIKASEFPVSEYFNKRNPYVKFSDFKGYFENLSFLWFRERTYLRPFQCVWRSDKAEQTLDYYTQLYNSIFYPRKHEKIDECKLGMLMCQNCVQRTRKKQLYNWMKDKISTPKATGFFLEDGQKESFIDHFVRVDPKKGFVEDLVLYNRVSSLLNNDEQIRSHMEMLCFSNRRYQLYGSRRDKNLNPMYAGLLGSEKIMHKMPMISWDAFNDLIFPCSILIYNIADSESERVEARCVVDMLIIKLLAMNPFDRLRFQSLHGIHTVIILSSLCTWGKTPFHLYAEFNDTPLFEEYYNKRVPLDEYRDVYDAESYFLDLAVQFKDILRIIVIGCGIIYGKDGTYTPDSKRLTDWLMCNLFQRDCPLIVGTGSNQIAFIHIKDLVRVIHQAIGFCPRNKNYIIACEMIACNQHHLMNILAQLFGPSPRVLHCDAEELMSCTREIDYQFLSQLEANIGLYPRMILESGFKVKHFWKNSLIKTIKECIDNKKAQTIRILVLGSRLERTKIAKLLSKIFGLPLVNPKICIKRFLKRMEKIEIDLNNEKLRQIIVNIAKARRRTLYKLKKRLKKIQKLKMRKIVKTTMVNMKMQNKLYLNEFNSDIPIGKCDLLKKYLYLPKYKQLKDYRRREPIVEKNTSNLLISQPPSKIKMTMRGHTRYFLPLHSLYSTNRKCLKRKKSKLVICDIIKPKIYEELEKELKVDEMLNEMVEEGSNKHKRDKYINYIYNNDVSTNYLIPRNEISQKDKNDSKQTLEVKNRNLNKPYTKKHLHKFTIEDPLALDGGDRKHIYALPRLHPNKNIDKTTDVVAISRKANSVGEVFTSISSNSKSNVSSSKANRTITVYHSYHYFPREKIIKVNGMENNRTNKRENLANNTLDDSVSGESISFSTSFSNTEEEQSNEIASHTLDLSDKSSPHESISSSNQIQGDTITDLRDISPEDESHITTEEIAQVNNTLVTERDIIEDFLMYFSGFSRHNINRIDPEFYRRVISSDTQRFGNPRLEKTPPSRSKNFPLVNDSNLKHKLSKKFAKLILKMFPGFKKEKEKRKMFFITPGEPPVLSVNGYPVFVFIRNKPKNKNLSSKHIIISRVSRRSSLKKPSVTRTSSTIEIPQRISLEKRSDILRRSSSRSSRSKLLIRSLERISSRFRNISKYSLPKGEKELNIRQLHYRIQCLFSIMAKTMSKMKNERHIILHEIAKLVRHLKKRTMVKKRKRRHPRVCKQFDSIATQCKLLQQGTKLGFKKGGKAIVRVSSGDPIIKRKFFNDFDDMMLTFIKNYEHMESICNIPNRNYICTIEGKEIIFEGTMHPCIYFADNLLKNLNCCIAYAGLLYSDSASSSDESDSELLKLSGLDWDDFSIESLIYIEMLLMNKEDNKKYLGLPPGVTKILIKDVKCAIQKKTEMFCNLKTSILLDLLAKKPCLRKDSRLIRSDDFDKRTLDELCLGELVYILKNLKVTEKTLLDPETIKLNIARIMLHEKEKNVNAYVRRFLSATSLGYKDTAIYDLVREAIVERLLHMPDVIPPLRCARCHSFNNQSVFSNPEIAFIVLKIAKEIIYRLIDELGEVITTLFRKRIENYEKGHLEEEPFDGYLYSQLTQKYPTLKTLYNFLFDRNLKFEKKLNLGDNLIQPKKNVRRRRLLRRYYRSGKSIDKQKISSMQSHEPRFKGIPSFIEIMDHIHTDQNYRLLNYRKPKGNPQKVSVNKHTKNKQLLLNNEYKNVVSEVQNSQPLNSPTFFFHHFETGLKKNCRLRNLLDQPVTKGKATEILPENTCKGPKGIGKDRNLEISFSGKNESAITNHLNKTLWHVFSDVKTSKYFSGNEKKELINILMSIRPIGYAKGTYTTKEKPKCKRLGIKKRKYFQLPLLGPSKCLKKARRKRLHIEFRWLKKLVTKVCHRLKNKPFLRIVKIALNRLMVSVSRKPEYEIQPPEDPLLEQQLSKTQTVVTKPENILKESNPDLDKKSEKQLKTLNLTFAVDDKNNQKYSSLSSLLLNRIMDECKPILKQFRNWKATDRLVQYDIDNFSMLISSTIEKQVVDIIMQKLLGHIIMNPNKRSPISFKNYRSLVKKFTSMPMKKKGTLIYDPNEWTSSFITRKYVLFGPSNIIGIDLNDLPSPTDDSIKEEQSSMLIENGALNERSGVEKTSQVSSLEYSGKREVIGGGSGDKFNVKEIKSFGFTSAKDLQNVGVSFAGWNKTKNERKVYIGPDDNGVNIEVRFERGTGKYNQVGEVIKDLRNCLRKIPKKKMSCGSYLVKNAKRKKNTTKSQKTKIEKFKTKRLSPPCRHFLLGRELYKRFKNKLRVVNRLKMLCEELKEELLAAMTLVGSAFHKKKSFLTTIQPVKDVLTSDIFSPSSIKLQKPLLGLPKAGQMVSLGKNLLGNEDSVEKAQMRKLFYDSIEYYTNQRYSKKDFRDLEKKKKNCKAYVARMKKIYLNYKSERFTLLKKLNQQNKIKHILLLLIIKRGIEAIKDAEVMRLLTWTTQMKIYLTSKNDSKCQYKINNILLNFFATELKKLTKGDIPKKTEHVHYERSRKHLPTSRPIAKKSSTSQNKDQKWIKHKDTVLYDSFKKLFQNKTDQIIPVDKAITKYKKLLKYKAAIILVAQNTRGFDTTDMNAYKILPKVTYKDIRACRKLQSFCAKNTSNWQANWKGFTKLRPPMKRRNTTERVQGPVMSRLIKREEKIRAFLNNVVLAKSIIGEVRDKKLQKKMKMKLFFKKQKLKRKLRYVIRDQKYFQRRIRFIKKKQIILEQYANTKKFIEELMKKQKVCSSFLGNQTSHGDILSHATIEKSNDNLSKTKEERNLRTYPHYYYQLQSPQECHCPKPKTYYHPKRIASQPAPKPEEPHRKKGTKAGERKKINVMSTIRRHRKRCIMCKRYKKTRFNTMDGYSKDSYKFSKSNENMRNHPVRCRRYCKMARKRYLINKIKQLRKQMKKKKMLQYAENMNKRRMYLFDQFIKDNELILKFQNRKYPSQLYHVSKLQEIRKTLQHRGKLKGYTLAVLMNEMLQEITFSGLSGYILEGFPRSAREAALMFSDPPIYCHCKLGYNKWKKTHIYSSDLKSGLHKRNRSKHISSNSKLGHTKGNKNINAPNTKFGTKKGSKINNSNIKLASNKGNKTNNSNIKLGFSKGNKNAHAHVSNFKLGSNRRNRHHLHSDMKLSSHVANKYFNELSNMNIPNCTGRYSQCYCEERSCTCVSSIKIDKSLFPRFLIMPVKYEKILPDIIPSKKIKNTIGRPPVKETLNLWKTQLKFKKQLRLQSATSASFFEHYGLPPTYIPFNDDNLLIKNIKKVVEIINQNDVESNYKSIESVLKRKAPEVKERQRKKFINKYHRIIKNAVKHFYDNTEATLAKEQWLVQFNNLLPKTHKYFVLMDRIGLISSIAAGIATVFVKSMSGRVEDPISLMAIQSFKRNGHSETLRKRTKVAPVRTVNRLRILLELERMIPIRPTKPNKKHLKKHHSISKIKDFFKLSRNKGGIHFMERRIVHPPYFDSCESRKINHEKVNGVLEMDSTRSKLDKQAAKKISPAVNAKKCDIIDIYNKCCIDNISPGINITRPLKMNSMKTQNKNVIKKNKTECIAGNSKLYMEDSIKETEKHTVVRFENQLNKKTHKSNVYLENPFSILRPTLEVQDKKSTSSQILIQKKSRCGYLGIPAPITALTKFPKVTTNLKCQRMISSTENRPAD